METYSLLISIVPRNCGEILTHAAVSAGSNGGTILMGRGTASNAILSMLGFGDTAKDVVLIVVPTEKKQAIIEAMKESVSEKKQPFGILFTTMISHFIKTGNISNKENDMSNTSQKLISVIVNKGFADDVMAEARKAGANGGTILNARGTAKEGDSKFFGMEIVPEKDMLLIVADNEKAENIVNAIKNLSFLQTPGSGIAFTVPADDFNLLGK